MSLYQEFKILTGLGHPDPAYVAEQITFCRDRIEACDHLIASSTTLSADVMRVYGDMQNSVFASDFFNGWSSFEYQRKRFDIEKKKAESRLSHLQDIADRL